jgi:phosphatidylserine/phosphatidylglycerophosphate/cardiolipin synthase-like enzyme
MANTGVQGKILDENNQPLSGLLVEARDLFVVAPNQRLKNTATKGPPLFGLVETDSTGKFTIAYSSRLFGLAPRPDIQVVVYDGAMRVVHTTAIFKNVSDPTLIVPDIKLTKADATGLPITLGKGTPSRFSAGNRVEYLIDDREAFGRLSELTVAATSSIEIMQLAWVVPEQPGPTEYPALFTKFDPGMPDINAKTTGAQLEKLVLDAAKARGLDVRILLHDAEYGVGVTAKPAVKYFDFWNANRTGTKDVEVCTLKMSAGAPLHAKIAIFDRKMAVIIGSPFMQEYFDDLRHNVDDARRGVVHRNVIGVWGYAMQVPVHEVSIQVEGPAVADFGAVFLGYWNEARNAAGLSAASAPPAPATGTFPGSVSLQVAGTSRGKPHFKTLDGETGILEAYLRAINSASSLIYLENQYVTNSPIVDALYLAVTRKPTLQVIVLLNNQMDIPPYNIWQPGRLRAMFERLAKADRSRVGLFVLWTHEQSSPPAHSKPRLIRDYVHAKAAVVDDQWATVGTANLDGVSLSLSEQEYEVRTFLFGPDLADPNLRGSEVNAVIHDAAAAADLRKKLWAEHLGLLTTAGDRDFAHASLQTPPSGGWLKLWNDAATAKVNGLKTAPNTVVKSRFLPFPRDAEGVPLFLKEEVSNADPTDRVTFTTQSPFGFLHLLGIDVTAYEVQEIVGSYDHENHKWL